MRKLLILITILSLTAGLMGCGKGETNKSSKEILYDIEMNSDINIEEYKKVLSEILTYREFDDIAKLLVREKYEDTVALSVFHQLETMQNSMKLIYPGVTSNTLEVKEDGTYPIYDERFNIIEYGTYDEYMESIEEFNNHDLNYVENIEASSDKIIMKVVNKYNGVFYVYATLQNGNITYINILK